MIGYSVDCHLFETPVNIVSALEAVASQENHDGPEYDLMMEAAGYIRDLERRLDDLLADENDDVGVNQDGFGYGDGDLDDGRS